MGVVGDPRIRRLRIVLPEDNELEAINPTTAPRSPGGALRGYVEVISEKPFKVDCVVHFQGFSQTWLPTSTMQSDGMTNTVSVGRHSIVSQVQHTSAEIFEILLANKCCLYKLPFEITIPKRSIEMPDSVPEEFGHFPPSFKQGTQYHQPGTGDTYMQPLIVYKLEAELRMPTLHTGDAAKAPRVSREVTLRPTGPARPPLDTRDFPREYQTSLTQTLRLHFRYHPIGRLELSTIEPKPLNLASTYPRPSTLVPIRLVFTELTRYKNTPAHPCDWQICVRTTIVAKTFYSVLPLFKYGQWTACMATGSTTMNLNASHQSSESRSPPATFWSLAYQAGHATWTAAIDVPVNVSKRIPPTFLSVLAARRYSVRVSVDVRNLSHSCLVVEAPLQVILDPENGREEQLEERPGSEGVSSSDVVDLRGIDDLVDMTSSPPEYE